MGDSQDSDEDLLSLPDPVVSPPRTQWSVQLSTLPPKLLHSLMSFQKEGVEFALSRNGRCMIADEMGLGKTIQAIAAAYAYRAEWPLLVVVPSSLRYPWVEELERWLPELQPGDINLVESRSHTAGFVSSKVTVLGYGLLTSDARPLLEALGRQRFSVVVVDESHYMKTRNAARTKILAPIVQSAKRAFLLTGTPALGRPEELFMQIDALYPKMFGTWTEYAKKYCNAHYRYFGRQRQWDSRGSSNLEDLHQRLNQIMIRRLKAQVLTQLPPKVRQRIPFDLPKDAAKEASSCLEAWERMMQGMRSGSTASENPSSEVMSLVTRMYKQTAIAKAGAVKDYIKMMLETEQIKFLVFAHHLTMLQACTEAVIEAKVGYIRIDGSVPSSERAQLVRKFQTDPAIRVAVLSIQAAGQGLTFTAASHVVFAELYWNPGQVKQAEDRAHRIGQTSCVHVHYLIAKGSFDTVMWAMLNRKETVTGSTLNGRKEYLTAEEGDKTKWDFLNFASAWTPSEMVLPLPERKGGAREGDNQDGLFFTHFEKNKQHDIRSFFSPGATGERKRKRTLEQHEEEEGRREEPVAMEMGPAEEGDHDIADADAMETDFSPQVQRLRTPRPSRNPAASTSSLSSRKRLARGRRLSLRGGASALVPRKLSEVQAVAAAPRERWACVACTYSNSGLLAYCEMCLTKRPEPEEPPGRPLPPKEDPLRPAIMVIASGSESEGESPVPRGPGAQPPSPPLVPQDKHPAPVTLPGDGQRSEDGDDGDGAARHSITTDQTEGPVEAQSGTQLVAEEDNGDDGVSSSLPLYPALQFCASRNTDRVFLYDKDGTPLNCNFVPLDIQLENWEDLPEAISKRRENRIQVVCFVRDWISLSAMKQRLLRRGGPLCRTPALGLEALAAAQRPHSSTKRYVGREDVAQASLAKAQQEGGSTRLVSKDSFFNKRRSASSLSPPASKRQKEKEPPKESVPGAPQAEASAESPGPSLSPSSSDPPGYLQALDGQGVPLCLHCQEPCPASPDDSSTATWDSRFCSHRCQEELRLRSSQPHMRARVLEAEGGACQQCGLAAHQLYLRVRDAPPAQRKDLLESTWLAQLPLKQLNEIIRAPVEGDFWQVDHIQPVYSGGGQCSLDNLQTLCTVCHRMRTSQQCKERSRAKKDQAASKVASSITRFFSKK
ncbi:DNA annealing helicase and endonuclease ZRANB3 isoform X2 [Gadus chalcogrammus]|nr:DNA annealing helicase and endonuclease ZRANB3 isoform X2 [Gadus chalcogrammus]XP_056443937.1 DNA annealing helicase and endonuclease ZRANB3 isoform X2 [Gadus chalcogrammus]